MSGDFDPRDLDSRERNDGIHDREDEWLTLGRGPHSAVVHDGDEDVRERDDDWREERDREPARAGRRSWPRSSRRVPA